LQIPQYYYIGLALLSAQLAVLLAIIATSFVIVPPNVDATTDSAVERAKAIINYMKKVVAVMLAFVSLTATDSAAKACNIAITLVMPSISLVFCFIAISAIIGW
jgi:hypothetical protein